MLLALPPIELIEEVTPLAAEEALPSVPEKQSPTLMTEGMLGELAPEAEATEACGVEEEKVELDFWQRRR